MMYFLCLNCMNLKRQIYVNNESVSSPSHNNPDVER